MWVIVTAAAVMAAACGGLLFGALTGGPMQATGALGDRIRNANEAVWSSSGARALALNSMSALLQKGHDKNVSWSMQLRMTGFGALLHNMTINAGQIPGAGAIVEHKIRRPADRVLRPAVAMSAALPIAAGVLLLVWAAAGRCGAAGAGRRCGKTAFCSVLAGPLVLLVACCSAAFVFAPAFVTADACAAPVATAAGMARNSTALLQAVASSLTPSWACDDDDDDADDDDSDDAEASVNSALLLGTGASGEGGGWDAAPGGALTARALRWAVLALAGEEDGAGVTRARRAAPASALLSPSNDDAGTDDDSGYLPFQPPGGSLQFAADTLTYYGNCLGLFSNGSQLQRQPARSGDVGAHRSLARPLAASLPYPGAVTGYPQQVAQARRAAEEALLELPAFKAAVAAYPWGVAFKPAVTQMLTSLQLGITEAANATITASEQVSCQQLGQEWQRAVTGGSGVCSPTTGLLYSLAAAGLLLSSLCGLVALGHMQYLYTLYWHPAYRRVFAAAPTGSDEAEARHGSDAGGLPPSRGGLTSPGGGLVWAPGVGWVRAGSAEGYSLGAAGGAGLPLAAVSRGRVDEDEDEEEAGEGHLGGGGALALAGATVGAGTREDSESGSRGDLWPNPGGGSGCGDGPTVAFASAAPGRREPERRGSTASSGRVSGASLWSFRGDGAGGGSAEAWGEAGTRSLVAPYPALGPFSGWDWCGKGPESVCSRGEDADDVFGSGEGACACTGLFCISTRGGRGEDRGCASRLFCCCRRKGGHRGGGKRGAGASAAGAGGSRRLSDSGSSDDDEFLGTVVRSSGAHHAAAWAQPAPRLGLGVGMGMPPDMARAQLSAAHPAGWHGSPLGHMPMAGIAHPGGVLPAGYSMLGQGSRTPASPAGAGAGVGSPFSPYTPSFAPLRAPMRSPEAARAPYSYLPPTQPRPPFPSAPPAAAFPAAAAPIAGTGVPGAAGLPEAAFASASGLLGAPSAAELHAQMARTLAAAARETGGSAVGTPVRGATPVASSWAGALPSNKGL